MTFVNAGLLSICQVVFSLVKNCVSVAYEKLILHKRYNTTEKHE